MPKKNGIVRPLGLALLVALGFGTVFALAVAWSIAIWEGLQHNASTLESLLITLDGTPLIQHYAWHDGIQEYRFRELDGREVPAPNEMKSGPWLAGALLASPRSDTVFSIEGRSRVARFPLDDTPPKIWYFLHDGARDGHGYFVGYDKLSKVCIGFIGRDGLRPEQPPAEKWFPIDGAKMADGLVFSRYSENDYWLGNYDGDRKPRKLDMISGNQLLEIDLHDGSVTTLRESPDLIAVRPFESVWPSKSAEDPESPFQVKLALRTTERVIVFDASQKQPAAFPIPEEFRERSFTFYDVSGGTALVISSRSNELNDRHEELAWIDTTGKVLRRADVTLNSDNPVREDAIARALSLAVPAPVVVAVVGMVFMPLENVKEGRAATYFAALAQFWPMFWPPLLVVSLLAAALAVYCYRRHRRFCQPYAAAWFVFILLTGLPGLVGYLFFRRWPVREKCPACGQAVPRDREACAKCGVAFPLPEPKGCEVFA